MQLIGQVLVAAVLTVLVGLAAGGGWPMFVMGAVLALALWVMLFAGSYATPHKGRVDTIPYAAAGAIALLLGYLVARVGDGPVWWAVGFILAGSISYAGLAAVPALRGGEDR